MTADRPPGSLWVLESLSLLRGGPVAGGQVAPWRPLRCRSGAGKQARPPNSPGSPTKPSAMRHRQRACESGTGEPDDSCGMGSPRHVHPGTETCAAIALLWWIGDEPYETRSRKTHSCQISSLTWLFLLVTFNSAWSCCLRGSDREEGGATQPRRRTFARWPRSSQTVSSRSQDKHRVVYVAFYPVQVSMQARTPRRRVWTDARRPESEFLLAPRRNVRHLSAWRGAAQPASSYASGWTSCRTGHSAALDPAHTAARAPTGSLLHDRPGGQPSSSCKRSIPLLRLRLLLWLRPHRTRAPVPTAYTRWHPLPTLAFLRCTERRSFSVCAAGHARAIPPAARPSPPAKAGFEAQITDLNNLDAAIFI